MPEWKGRWRSKNAYSPQKPTVEWGAIEGQE